MHTHMCMRAHTDTHTHISHLEFPVELAEVDSLQMSQSQTQAVVYGSPSLLVVSASVISFVVLHKLTQTEDTFWKLLRTGSFYPQQEHIIFTNPL